MKKIIILVITLFFITSCKEERRDFFPFKFQKASLIVYVEHPVKGTGPGFLVNAYENKEDLANNKPYASARTDNYGVARFIGDLHTGLFYIDCLVIDDTLYYKMDSIWVVADTTLSLYLQLEKMD